MKSQRDTSLRIRLASMAILGLFIALAAAAYFSGQQVKRSSELIVTDAVPGTIAAHDMRMDISRSVGFMMVAASALTTQSRDASIKIAHDADVAFTNDVTKYKTTIKINPAEDWALLGLVTNRFAEFQRHRMTYEALILAGNREGSSAFLETNLVSIYVAATQSAEELLKYNHTNSTIYANYIRNSVHRLYWAVAVVMVLALFCAAVLLVNITIRQREIRRLRESEEKFSKAFQSNPVGISITEMETGEFLEVNESFCRLTGYSPQELAGRTSVELRIWSGVADRKQGFKSLLAGETMRDLELQIRTRDGSGKTVLVNAETIELGGKRCIVALVQDITGRKQAEAAMRESEQKYRDIVEQSPLGIFRSSVEGRLISVNTALAAMFGYDTPEQMVSDDETILSKRYARPEQRQEIVRSASESPVSIQREVECRRRNGTIFPANLYMRAVRAANGAIQYLEGLIEDISIRKRAVEQLEMLKVSIDKHFDGAFWMDTDNRFVYVNDSACKALGYAREELLGQPMTMIAPNATPQTLEQVWKGLRETGFFARESKHRRKDGSEFPVEMVASYVRFEGKEFNCGFARDITERKAADEALRQRVEEVRQRNAELERFNEAGEGRELRMIELKKEVNELLHRAGQPPQYRVDFTSTETLDPSA